MRASWWTAVQALIGLPLAFVVNLVVARTLGPHGYGTVASYIAAYALIVVVLNAGISDATVQWGAAAHARGDRDQLLEICRRCSGYHLLVEAPLSGIAAAILLHREALWVQVGGALAVAAAMALGTTVVLLSAISMNAPLAKLTLVVGLAVQLGVVTAAVETHDAGPTWMVRCAISVLTPAGALFFSPRDLLRASFSPRLPRRWPEGFAKYSARSLVATLIGTLVLSRCELLVLDAYGDTAAAGLFALAAGLALQITAPVDAMLGPLIPAAASLVAVGRERAAGAVLRGIRLSALITTPIAAIAVPAVAVLTSVVYGHRFASSGALFIALGIVSCYQSVMHSTSAFVGALRKPLLSLAVNGAALAVDLLLVVALVPAFGAPGAVAGNSGGQLVALVAPAWILRRHLDLSLRAIVQAVVPFACVALWVGVVSAGALVAREAGSGTVPVALTSIVAALVGSALAIRVNGGVVTAADLAAVEAGFPRGGARASRVLHAFGMVRADVSREG